MAAHFTLNPSCHCSSRLFHLVSSLQDWPDMVLKKRCCVQPLGPSCHLVQLCSAVFSCVQLSVVSLCSVSPKWVLQKGQLLLQDGCVCHLCLLLPHPILLRRYSTSRDSRDSRDSRVSMVEADMSLLSKTGLHGLQLFHHSTTLLLSTSESHVAPDCSVPTE